jgi:hypothetical protein
MSTIFGFILGALAAFVATLFAESMKRPVLSFELDASVDADYSKPPRRPATKARFARIRLVNRALPPLLRGLNRNAALFCRGRIEFKRSSGERVFDTPMAARWSSTPEPIPMKLMLRGSLEGEIVDHFRYDQRVDIPAGASELFDVAAQFDDEKECYGWSNESYGFGQNWRNPRRKLDGERFRVDVTIFHLGGSCSYCCDLVNSGGGMRLEKADDRT